MTPDDVTRLSAAHHAALVRYLARLTGDPNRAADAAQQASVRLIDRPPVFVGTTTGLVGVLLARRLPLDAEAW